MHLKAAHKKEREWKSESEGEILRRSAKMESAIQASQWSISGAAEEPWAPDWKVFICGKMSNVHSKSSKRPKTIKSLIRLPTAQGKQQAPTQAPSAAPATVLVPQGTVPFPASESKPMDFICLLFKIKYLSLNANSCPGYVKALSVWIQKVWSCSKWHRS